MYLSPGSGESVFIPGLWGECIYPRALGRVYLSPGSGESVFIPGLWGECIYPRALGRVYLSPGSGESVFIPRLWGECIYPQALRRVYLSPGSEESVFHYREADPYNTEVEVFLAAVRTHQPQLVRSTYDDALKTYQLSWAIRRACE